MKSTFLFLLIVFTIVTINTSVVNSWAVTHTCEPFYGVSSCSKCQKALWQKFHQPDEYASSIKLANIIHNLFEKSHNTSLYFDTVKEGIKDFCAIPSVADPAHLQGHLRELEAACPKELKTSIPNAQFFVDSVYGSKDTTFLAHYVYYAFYFGIPDRKALCTRDENENVFKFYCADDVDDVKGVDKSIYSVKNDNDELIEKPAKF
ncbi:5969_t:CDS:2, partial [Entrophospora sp. SA101]